MFHTIIAFLVQLLLLPLDLDMFVYITVKYKLGIFVI